jgi:hypothetical protein
MAREEKRVELRPVDETPAKEERVIRLESEETAHRAKPARLVPQEEPTKTSHRLDLPAREDYESRTHQPGIEALIENEMADPDTLEQDWGKSAKHHRSIPWGWFALIGILLAGAAIWSLTGVKKADVKAEKIRVATESVMVNDEKENREAEQLIERIDAATRDFFKATDVDTLARHVRQPERVRPLMERHYDGAPPTAKALVRTKLLQPLTLDNRANFWMKSVEFTGNESRNLIIEVMENGEPKIDWETLVCYQPMPWDHFATQRPEGASLDFRVYVEPDNFYSHEFADANQWHSFRLTALDADETLFGYARIGSPVDREITEQLNRNQGMRTSMILRLAIPEGILSRRGVMIEKLVSPRWLHIDPPDSGS